MVFRMCAPQTMDLSFKAFSHKLQFEHKTSSPGYLESKGKAEQAVKAAKTLMKKAKKAGTDPYPSLLLHRNTPTQGLDSCPVQLLMSRRTKTLLPTTVNLLKPKLCINADRKLSACKQRQAHYYNKGDLEDRKLGNVVRLFPIGSGAKEPVKTIVQSNVSLQISLLKEASSPPQAGST